MTQSQIDPPVTANRSERRSATRKRRAPRVLLLVPVVLVAVGAVLILTLGGGKDGGIIGTIIGGEDNTVPPFDFRLAKTVVVPTAVEADKSALKTQAEAVRQDVAPVLDALYTNAFLDPGNWRDGDYDSVFELFSDEAASSAEQSVETLTLGATAGDVYDTVSTPHGSLDFDVLFDQDGNPDTVVVDVSFVALGARKDGTYTKIVSTGELFLTDSGGWRITAFDVRRADRQAKPPASPTPSGSASASGSS